MMWAIVKKPELSAVSAHDPRTDTRTDSERFRDFAEENGIDENDTTWVRMIGKMASWNDDGISGDCVYRVRTGGCF